MISSDFTKHLNGVKNVLLVYPNFPTVRKSRNHKDSMPIGLLKIASLLRKHNINFQLVFPNDNIVLNENPDLICITSLYTYYSKYVKEAVDLYKEKYPQAKIMVGGVYASLLPEQCEEYTQCDIVFTGIIEEAEDLPPAYDLIDSDTQIIFSSRGCVRKCSFCGTYLIEPKFTYKKSIKNEVVKRKIVFYDNELLANPYIKDILKELIELKKSRKISYVESQSGFDGRILLQHPELGKMIKDAGFKNPRIAWDCSFSDADNILKQIKILEEAGYKRKHISIYMIFNWDIPFNEMEKKRAKCFEWGVQITDCRYRPLDMLSDNYNPYTINQTNEDYYIHPLWTDKQNRTFRRHVRRTNIAIRQDTSFYSYKMESKQISKGIIDKVRNMSAEEASKYISDIYDPMVVSND